MRQAILAAALAATGLVFGYASANAQSIYSPESDVEVEAYAGGPSREFVPKPIGPRVYGYYEDEAELGRPDGPNGCGTYFYWNGERCVDARNKR